MPGQVTYSLDNPNVIPGQIFDAGDDIRVEKYIALEVIPPGVAVELAASGLGIQNPQGTGATIPNYVGVAVYKDGREPGAYAIGDIVPVLRKGRIAVQIVAGSTITALGTACNVSHSSTLSVDRGKFTSTAANGTAGTEITAVNAIWRKDPVVTNVAIIEINAP